MPATPSSETLIRAHFGLLQAQLARYLGVPVAVLAHYEAGRRVPGPALADRLIYLGRLLPPPLGQGPPAAPGEPAPEPFVTVVVPAELPATAPLEPELIHRRLRDCRLQALVLGEQLARLHARAAVLAHRRRGLAQLTAAAPPAAPAEAAHYAHWLAGVAEDLALADPQPTAAATSRLLLAVRLGALQAEAEALARYAPAG